jgi:hypothetical protein
MPLSQFRSHYKPDQHAKLVEAFNLVWPKVMLAKPVANTAQLEWLRERLENFIVACASGGEFEPERLRATALRAFTKQSRGMSTGESNATFESLNL